MATALNSERTTDIWLSHEPTGARLHVRFDTNDTESVTLLLSSPLEVDAPDDETSIIADLLATHEQIANTVSEGTDAVEPVADGRVLAIASLAPEDSQSAVAETIGTLSQITRDVEAVYSELRTVLHSWPAESCTEE